MGPHPSSLRAGLAAAIVAGLLAGSPIAPGPLGNLLAPAVEAKAKLKRHKAARVSGGTRVIGRLPSSSSPSLPPNPGLNFPNPNLPAYNSGTVAPLVVPRPDPIVPGGRYVPQVPPVGRGPETYQDRVVRCTHQSGLGGLSGGQSGVYIHNCSM
jgi:hypothetical protein